LKTYRKAIPAILVATAITPNVYADATANPDSATMNQGDGGIAINVVANDTTNYESTIWVQTYDSASAHGGRVYTDDVSQPSTLHYTPPSDSYAGTDTFTYTAVDDSGYGSSTTVTVTVEATATPSPIAIVLTENEQKVATDLDHICALEVIPDGLIDLCSTTGAERLAAIQQLVPSQLPSQGNYSVELQHNQFMNITSRLVQLRAGVTGMNTSNLSLNFEGQPLLTKGFAYLLSNKRGGGASADESSSMGRIGMFINGSGSFGDRDTTDRELGFDFSTSGISAGIDYRASDKLVFGGALGYVSNNMDFATARGDQDITGYTVSAYGSWYQSENAYIDGILSYGTNTFDLTRQIQFGSTNVDAQGNTDGTEIAVSVGGAYDLSRNALSFGPFARVNYIKAKIDAFEENPASGLELAYDKQKVDSLTALIGGQASYVFSTKHGVITPQARLEWAHEFKHDSHDITARFLNDPTTGRFAIGTDEPDRDYFNLGLGVTAVFAEGRSAFIYYETVISRDNLTQNSLAAGVRFEF
jgi:outer membrane autotransporter protein